MAGLLIKKYIWLIDTIQRHGPITLKDIASLWKAHEISGGNRLPRRSFLNYRNGAEEVFGVSVKYNSSTHEYSIDNTDQSEVRMRNWLLDSMSLSNMLSNASDISSRIMIEAVPSARNRLPIIVDSLKQLKRISFTYKAYDRSQAHTVVVEPYCVRIFKQLWYVIGVSVKDRRIKTYALDRMSDLRITGDSYIIPSDFNAEEYFKYCFGITTSRGSAKDIVLHVKPMQAKYFRALPLHPSQSEELHDEYSVFHYHMYITYDLIQQLLSYGPEIKVIEPRELRVQLTEKLQAALEQYK
ncbi:MAG: WYL domain-containing protein [Muribaculaceae bacterium]